MALPPGLVITPEYRSEDNCPPVNDTAIAFVVLETIIFIVYWISRYIKKPNTYRILPWLMVGGYLFSCSLAVETLCTFSNIEAYMQLAQYTDLWNIVACNRKFGGGGHHITLTPKATVVRRFKISKAIEWCYIPACTCSKFVVLLLYYSIFARHRRWLRYACYAIAIAMIRLFRYGVISPALSCKPFAYNWDKSIPGGKCIDLVAAYR
jgi:hypothetical protein